MWDALHRWNLYIYVKIFLHIHMWRLICTFKIQHLFSPNVNTEIISGDASLNANLPITENFWQKLRKCRREGNIFDIDAFHRHWCKYGTIIESKYISKNIEHTHTHTHCMHFPKNHHQRTSYWKDFHHFLLKPFSAAAHTHTHTRGSLFFVLRTSSSVFVLISFFGTGRARSKIYSTLSYINHPFQKFMHKCFKH